MIGHTKAAAGVAGLIKTALALKNKVLPPSIKVDEPLEIINPGTAPIYLNTIKRPWVKTLTTPRRAALSSFGFGGSNFHCVLEEAEESKADIDWDGQVLIIALSAESKSDLINQLPENEIIEAWNDLRHFAFDSCQSFNPEFFHRLTIVIEKAQKDLESFFNEIKDQLQRNDDEKWQLPGAVYSSKDFANKIAFAFPGQGSQYTGMCRDLACQFPQFFSALEEASTVFSQNTDEILNSIIYPVPVFAEAHRKQQEETLRQTQNAQPAIGAVSLGALNVLKHFNIEADIAVGHSYGELTALHAAGYYDAESFHCLSRMRGELMNKGEGDRGAMLAVVAKTGQVKELLKENNIDLVIANHNSPKQVVLSGATDQIEKFADIAKIKKIRVIRLPVAAAFHSSFVADAAKPFAEALAKVQFQKNTIQVLSNTTGEPYPDGRDGIKKLLAEQLANPVRFVEQVECLYADGIDTFVEVGPGKTLSGLIGTILSEKEITNLSIDASMGKKHGQYDLAIVLATLAAKGIRFDLDKWDACSFNIERPETENKPGMTVSISGANVMMPREPRPPRKQRPSTPVNQMTNKNNEPATGNQDKTNNTTQQTMVTTANDNLLQATQESILALQRMQEQTARLHQQYLQGQETAQQTIQRLLEQQQRLISGQPLSTEPVSININQPVPEQTQVVPEKQQEVKQQAVVKEIEETRQQNEVDIDNLLLKVVSEKTGYPLEMLSLDMSLDTDLGIDSIKRVEILSALQEKLPWSASVNPEELGTFQFLQHIVEFIAAGRPASDAVHEPVKPVVETAKPDNNFEKILLEVVAEKTGYPIEMLELDMNLDSDLGIDSIKRVEILSAIQEQLPELPTVSPDELGQLQTLRSIVELFALEQTTGISEVVEVEEMQGNFAESLLEVVAEKTGYPVDMLSLEMNLDSDLGIDSIKRVEILSAMQERIPELPTVNPDEMASLQTLQSIVDIFTDQNDPIPIGNKSERDKIDRTPGHREDVSNNESAIARSVIRITDLNEDRQPIKFDKKKEIWINENGGELAERIADALKDNGYKTRLVKNNKKPVRNLAGLIICAVEDPNKQWLLDTFQLIQSCSVKLNESKGLLTTITTLGGTFGFKNVLKASAIQAGLHGILKTADKEWLDVSCKSIDIDNDSILIDSILKELFLQGPLEVGLVNDQAIQLVLEQEALVESSKENSLLDKKDFVIITGGARGVTAEVAVKLAEAYQCNLLLLGRSPEPEDEPEWLASLTEDAAIKKAILDNSDEKLSPSNLEKQYQSILANREIKATLERIEKAGSDVQYVSADVTDLNAVENVINLARIDLGNVSGVIHAAGVLADRLIEDKTQEQFNLVYSTKVDGLQNLLTATANDDLKLIITFSSTTARLGRKGQVDYAAANEILNKIAQCEHQVREDCKVLSVNWGPWDGGMVTPALKKIFAEEGVGVIGLNAGADYLIQEIESDGPVETIVLGESENVLSAIPLNESKASIENTDLKIAFERDLSVSSYAFLTSHVMNGQAVLPVAVILEWFAHGALHLNPGMQFHGFDDFRVLKGVTLKADENIHLSILAGNMVFKETCAYVPVELRSNEHLHASAVVVLADSYEKNVLPKLEAVAGNYQFKQGEYYKNGQLFHGQHLQGIKEILHCSDKGIVANVNSAPAPSEWMSQPIRSNWLTDPLVLDSAFQMMILWSFEQQGIGSLPTAISHYRQYQRSFPKNGSRIVAEVIKHTNNRANASIEFIDNEGKLIAIMDGYECVRDGSLQTAFKENDLSLQS
ncbi:MAG: SDR family NAD(P)-dependent oxidoreductase [Proteobacteria bacterium]|nr:SDR family NAD(P)-dependent oxidoreductase [Pseudomonadota bacterium]